MSEQQSLTSLKLQPTPRVETSDTSSQKAQSRLTEILAEIELAIKKKNQLDEELEQFRQSAMSARKRINLEIGELKTRKKRLLKQVEALSTTLLDLKGAKVNIIKAYEGFGQERVGVLDNIARTLKLDIKDETGKLLKKSNLLAKQEEFLNGLENYLVKFGEIVETTHLSNILEGQKTEKMAKDIIDMKAITAENFELAQDKLSEADRKLREIDENYKSIGKVVKFFMNEADIEREKLEEWSKTTSLHEKIIKAKEREFGRIEKRLKDWEIRLKDKEETFKRVAKELEIKQKMV